MSFKIGDRVRILPGDTIFKSFWGCTGVIQNILPYTLPGDTFMLNDVRLDMPSPEREWFFPDHVIELLYPTQQLSTDLLKEDDHAGQHYNQYNDTWTWL